MGIFRINDSLVIRHIIVKGKLIGGVIKMESSVVLIGELTKDPELKEFTPEHEGLL